MEFLISLLSGGATGILGTLVGRVVGFYENKQKFQHELKLLELQAKIGAEESERELAIAQAKAASDLRVASYRHDSETGQGSQWVTNTLRLIRPALTIVLVLAVIMLWFTAEQYDEDIRTQVVVAIIYLATSAVTWWFGDRAPTASKK
jgi:DMSO reductase anchor subunit